MTYGIDVVLIYGFLFIFRLILYTIAIGLVIFWILMLVDVIKRKFSREKVKISWLLVILITGIIGAFIYYHKVRKKYKK
ncbi:MAG: PLDc N-terminal domain-containing protein [Candidatus Aenigmarchaeota archaeon]|nr:PLDc N-terminal domain-containing protein [Candidatus Aenigmarchaeota archaeon]